MRLELRHPLLQTRVVSGQHDGRVNTPSGTAGVLVGRRARHRVRHTRHVAMREVSILSYQPPAITLWGITKQTSFELSRFSFRFDGSHMLVITLSTFAWRPSHLRDAGPPAARTPAIGRLRKPVMALPPPQRQISDHVAAFGKKVEAATSTHLAGGWQQVQTDASGGWQQMQAQLEGFERALANASFSAKSAKAKAARAKAEAEQAESSAAAARAAQARGLLSARAEQAEASAAAAGARASAAEAAAAKAFEGQAKAELAIATLEATISHAQADARLARTERDAATVRAASAEAGMVQAVEALTVSQAAVEEMEAALQDAKERVWAADDSLEMTQDALSRESRARRAAEGDAVAMRTERDVAVPHPALTLHSPSPSS